MGKDNFINYFLLGSIFLIFLILSPVLDSGYVSDDSLNSLVPGYLLEENTDVLSFSLPFIYSWVVNEGRFFPIAFLYAYSLFSLSFNLFSYKLFLIIMILINSFLFYFLVKIISKSNFFAIFSLLIIPIFLKVTLHHNPILSFNGLIQVLFSLILLSLIAFIFYLETQSRYYLLISVGLYLFSLFTYEISYPLFLLHFIILFAQSTGKKLIEKLRIASYFFIAPIFCIFLSKLIQVILERRVISGTSQVYSINWDIASFFISMAKEVSGTIPLSYILFDPHKIFYNITIFPISSNLLSLIVCIGILSFLLFFEVTKRLAYHNYPRNTAHSNKYLLPFLGLGFMLLPLIPIAITSRHQVESTWGYSYLPGYISAFGASLCITCIVHYFFLKLPFQSYKKFFYLILFFSAFFSIFCMITFFANAIVVEKSNSDWLYPRNIVEEGMNNGVFKDIPNNSIVFVDNSHKWDQPAFYRMHTGIQFAYLGSPHTPTYYGPFINKKIPMPNASCSDNLCHYFFSGSNPGYYINYLSNSKSEGMIILGKINDISVTNQTILGVTADQIRIYVKSSEMNRLGNTAQVIIFGQWKDKNGGSSYKPFILDENELILISEGNQWKLFSLNTEGRTVDLLSLIIAKSIKNYRQSIQIYNKDLFFQNYEMGNYTDFSHTGENTQFQINFESGYFGEGIHLSPISLYNDFSIQLLVKPGTQQVPYAAIVGNHPGYNGFEGFIIQQSNINQNDYTFTYGNGVSWEPSIQFHLTESEWNYLVVNVEDKKVFVYNNGELIGLLNVTNPIKNSNMPLYIGNWIGNDRQYNGSINEVGIYNSTISYETVKSNWVYIQNKMKIQ